MPCGAQSGNAWTQLGQRGQRFPEPGRHRVGGQDFTVELEASTVDLGEEFTNMIITQRAYSASSRIITTADQMLEELVRIKR